MLITSKVFEPEPWNLKRAILKALSRSMQKIELLTDLGKFSSLSLPSSTNSSNIYFPEKDFYLVLWNQFSMIRIEFLCLLLLSALGDLADIYYPTLVTLRAMNFFLLQQRTELKLFYFIYSETSWLKYVSARYSVCWSRLINSIGNFIHKWIVRLSESEQLTHDNRCEWAGAVIQEVIW